MMTIVFLPQNLQLQNGLTPVCVGSVMLTQLLLSATGSAIGNIMSSKHNISWYLLVGSLALYMVGLGLMSTLSVTEGPAPSAQFGYQTLLGMGSGLALGSLVVQLEVRERDNGKYSVYSAILASMGDMNCISFCRVFQHTNCMSTKRGLGIVMGIITQVCEMGGVIGVTIEQAIISWRLIFELEPVLGSERLAKLLYLTAIVHTLPSKQAALVKECYSRALTLQNRVMPGFAVAVLVSMLGVMEKEM